MRISNVDSPTACAIAKLARSASRGLMNRIVSASKSAPSSSASGSGIPTGDANLFSRTRECSSCVASGTGLLSSAIACSMLSGARKRRRLAGLRQ